MCRDNYASSVNSEDVALTTLYAPPAHLRTMLSPAPSPPVTLDMPTGAHPPPPAAPPLSEAEKRERDSRSVFVSNLDADVTVEDLMELFGQSSNVMCATIKRTRDGLPRGYAYIELAGVVDAKIALRLNGTILNGRTLRVLPKRTNIAGMRQFNPMYASQFEPELNRVHQHYQQQYQHQQQQQQHPYQLQQQHSSAPSEYQYLRSNNADHRSVHQPRHQPYNKLTRYTYD